MPPPDDSGPAVYDVAIAGGALAGTATALLLLQADPSLRVVILERNDAGAAAAGVGEAAPELASFFLGRVLGLGAHLNEDHFTRNGARFWFAGADSTFETAGEIGNKYLARLPTYLIDRSVLDAEMRRRAVALGAEWRHGAAVARVELAPGAAQALTLASGETLRARWAVDASGSAALLARQEGWRRPNGAHPAAAVWGRWRGVKDWESAELRRKYPAWAAAAFGARSTAVNILTGDGWHSEWVALRGGQVSLRVTGDPRLTELPASAAQARAFLEARHPVAREMLAGAELVEGSSGAASDLAFGSDVLAGDGFVLVGGAAGHIGSLYGHDLDWMASTVAAAAGLIAAQRRGERDLPARLAVHNADFAAASSRWFDSVFRDKAEYLGEFDLMRVATLFDLGLYILCVARAPYREGAAALARPPFARPAGFARLLRLVNRRCARLAQVRRAQGRLGRSNTGRRALFTSFNFNRASAVPLLSAARHWLGLEITEGWRSWR